MRILRCPESLQGSHNTQALCVRPLRREKSLTEMLAGPPGCKSCSICHDPRHDPLYCVLSANLLQNSAARCWRPRGRQGRQRVAVVTQREASCHIIKILKQHCRGWGIHVART